MGVTNTIFVSFSMIVLWNNSVSLSTDCFGRNHDFIILDGLCTECPTGLFGINCSHACAADHYGVDCQEVCNCPIDEFCHPIFGCVQLSQNGTILQNTNGTNSNETCSVPESERLYGIPIQNWLWISLGLLGSNIFILMVCCCMCSSLKGCKPKEYHPKQMFDFLKILVEATGRGQSSQAANQNAYIVEDYTEIAEMLPAPPPPPKPSTSFDESDCGYMEPRVTIKPQVARSKSCDGGTTDENAGYNSLTLRNDSTATLDQDQEYAMVIPKAERGKGKAGADGKSKVKSKLDTLKQIGGRISDMFAADKSSDSRTQVAFDSFRPVVEDNIYTIDADASPEEYSGRDIDEIPPLPQHYPTPIKDGHEYRVLEPQTGYTDCSENEVFSPDCKRKPFEYDVARNDNYSKARKMSNLTASGAFLLSISSDHYSDTSVV